MEAVVRMMNYILYGLSCVNLRSFVRTGLSPPEEEPSFHSVRAQQEEVMVFPCENQGGSTQHTTRATPIRSSHGPMRA